MTLKSTDTAYSVAGQIVSSIDFFLQVQQAENSFCAAYECHLDKVGVSERWGIGFEVCVCPKQDANKEKVPKNILKKYPLYCDFGVTLHDGKTLSCPQDKNKGKL